MTNVLRMFSPLILEHVCSHCWPLKTLPVDQLPLTIPSQVSTGSSHFSIVPRGAYATELKCMDELDILNAPFNNFILPIWLFINHINVCLQTVVSLSNNIKCLLIISWVHVKYDTTWSALVPNWYFYGGACNFL